MITLKTNECNITTQVSRMSAFTYAGAHLGTVASLPLTGLLCDAAGWQFAFYAFGALGVVWFAGENC